MYLCMCVWILTHRRSISSTLLRAPILHCWRPSTPCLPSHGPAFYKSTLNSLNCPSLLAELHNTLHMFSSEPWSTAPHANTQCQQLRHGGGIPLGPLGIKKWRMQNLLQRSLCTCWSDIQRLSVHLIIHAPASGYYHPPSANTTRATFLLLLAGTFELLLGW